MSDFDMDALWQKVQTNTSSQKVDVKSLTESKSSIETVSDNITQPKRPRSRTGRQSSSDSVCLHAFPKSLVIFARSEFPELTRQDDVVAAYVLAKSNKINSFDGIPENVKKAALAYQARDKTVDNLDTRLRNVEKSLMVLSHANEMFEYAFAYLIADRLGFRERSASNPSMIDFKERSVEEVLGNLKKFIVDRRNARYKK